MDFSDATDFTGPAPLFSPDGKHIASTQEYRLVIRDSETLTVLALFSCLDKIERISWSPNSDHLLCGLFKRGVLQIFSVSDPEWNCTISEGLAGIVSALFSPNGQQVLITADFQIKLSVWSLITQTCIALQGPKHPTAGKAFSPDGLSLAVLGRSDCKDSITLYDTATWEPTCRFALKTVDADDIKWSPDSSSIAVWDSPSQSHRITVYSREGQYLATYSAYNDALGIKAVTWSPSGHLLAIGSFDQGLKILNNVTWQPLCEFQHTVMVNEPETLAIYHEEEEDQDVLLDSTNANGLRLLGPKIDKAGSRLNSPTKGSPTKGSPQKGSPTKQIMVSRPDSPSKLKPPTPLSYKAQPASNPWNDTENEPHSKYVVATLPARISSLKPPMDKPNPKLGVGWIAWSFDGAYVASRCDQMPSAVWIWDTARLEAVSILVHARNIKSLEWHPHKQHLAIVTGVGKLFMWTPEGASCASIPLNGFKAHSLAWSLDGMAILLRGKDSFACAYTIDD